MVTLRIITILVIIIYVILIDLSSNNLWGLLLGGAFFSAFIGVNESRLLEGQPLLIALKWFLLLGFLALIYIFTLPKPRLVKAFDGSKKHGKPVKTEMGDFIGILNGASTVELFAGIPYAKPPVGDLRFREPQDPDKLKDPLLCDRFAPMAMQKSGSNLRNNIIQLAAYHDYVWFDFRDPFKYTASEDCLYLNIWRPAGLSGNEKLPVIVYIHGGSLQFGQTWYKDCSGENIAKDGAIFVNMGYRLGVFGFLALNELQNESKTHTTGNYGLLDQLKALSWVRSNIAAFGGDPSNITLAGESAGAACVSALMASPIAKNLFARTVLESSTLASKIPPHSFRTFDEALESGQKVLKRFGVKTVEELRKLPAEVLLKATDTEHHITVDGYVLTKTPYEYFKEGSFNGYPVLHGFNEQEIAPFIMLDKANMKNFKSKVDECFKEYANEVLELYQPKNNAEARFFWEEIYGAVFFDYSHYCLNRLAVKNNMTVYEYFFKKYNKRIGAWHSGEQVYLYKNIPNGSRLYNQSDRALMVKMSGALLDYIKEGDPSLNLPEWEPNTDSCSYLKLGNSIKMIKERKRKLSLYAVLDKMQGFEA